MGKNSSREFPVEFKRHLVDLFFRNLNNPSKITELRDFYARRGEGYNEELFFWMEPDLHPISLRELREILNDKNLTLGRNRIEEYLETYKRHYRL